MKEIVLDNIKISNARPIVLIAGPCVIEDEKIPFKIAEELLRITDDLGIPFIYKASYDKANRSSISSFRGIGINNALGVLSKIKEQFNIPVLSDVHSKEEIAITKDILDVIQIPAFLCRQTDLLVSAGETGKAVNVKKGQFMSPWDMKNVIEKIISTKNEKILLTERGTSFGYNNLVVDFRGLSTMAHFGYPVIFDATHSVQLPGGMGTSSGGQREFVEPLVRAAVAVGCAGLFLEVHISPDEALCDGANMISVKELPDMLKRAISIDKQIKEG
ncbi:3-deoxy-8-phosphooctulonate synthase [bacterium]|nr:3-deoxy-8-phosphooctulonate synthase [bacterium]